jgi:hypothetical protein
MLWVRQQLDRLKMHVEKHHAKELEEKKAEEKGIETLNRSACIPNTYLLTYR